MNLCIKNCLGDKITLWVSETITIRQVIQIIYNKNTLLKNNISFEIYVQNVQLSLNAQELELDSTLEKYGIDALSIIDLILIQSVNFPKLNDANFIDLQLELPQIPEDLRCPISTQIFLNPVKIPTTGAFIEKSVLVKWVLQHGTCPFSRKEIQLKTAQQLQSDTEMQEKVAIFLKKHEERAYFPELKALQYQEEKFRPTPQLQPILPAEPDDDDWLAIRNAQNENQNVHPLHVNSSFHFFYDNEYRSRCLRQTLAALGRYGVTENLIIENWQPSSPTAGWSEFEHDALVFFISGRTHQRIDTQLQAQTLPETLRLSPINALREITNLCDGQLTALCKLYERGLRGTDLRNWRGANNQKFFMHDHTLALIALVEIKNLPVREALERIRDTSEAQAWNIYRECIHMNRSRQIMP